MERKKGRRRNKREKTFAESEREKKEEAKEIQKEEERYRERRGKRHTDLLIHSLRLWKGRWRSKGVRNERRFVEREEGRGKKYKKKKKEIYKCANTCWREEREKLKKRK